MNISQIAKLSGLSSKQIRDYEKAGLLSPPSRNISGYRQYCSQDLKRLHFISNARKVNFSLKQIAELLKLNDNANRSSREVKQITELHLQTLNNKIADLEKMVLLLQQWNRACCGDDSPNCPILDGLVQEEQAVLSS